MKTTLQTLLDVNVSDPTDVRTLLSFFLQATNDPTMIKEIEEILCLNDQILKIYIQQIIAGS